MEITTKLHNKYFYFYRLCLQNGSFGCLLSRCFTNSSNPLLFRASAPLLAEPMKKKKKMDMNIIVQREAKKRKKLEKLIKKLELKGRVLKPIEEIEGDRNMLKTFENRKRNMPAQDFEESEYRAHLHKDWTRYKTEQFTFEMKAISQAVESQRTALNELRSESEELYQLAIQLDEKIIPFERNGPVETPLIKAYIPPDGEYIDTTRKFDK